MTSRPLSGTHGLRLFTPLGTCGGGNSQTWGIGPLDPNSIPPVATALTRFHTGGR
jgi:hypothetical protein